MIDLSSQSFTSSQHQAAGHDGCLSADNGAIFAKLTSQQEIDFYNEAHRLDQKAESENPDLQVGSLLSDWMPVYMGTLTQGDIIKETDLSDRINAIVLPSDDKGRIKTEKDNDKKYIVLQNLLYGFKKPSILDIKLGSVLTDSSASAEKVKRLKAVSDSTTSGSMSFRICGMKVYNGSSADFSHPLIFPDMEKTVKSEKFADDEFYLLFDKFFGRSLTKDNVDQALKLYFQNSFKDPAIVEHLIQRFHQRLQLVYNTLVDAEVRIISGSLFFIYENDLSRWKGDFEEQDPLVRGGVEEEEDSDDEVEALGPLSCLHLIDFAHAKHVPGQGCDENILKGVENLIDIFEQL